MKVLALNLGCTQKKQVIAHASSLSSCHEPHRRMPLAVRLLHAQTPTPFFHANSLVFHNVLHFPFIGQGSLGSKHMHEDCAPCSGFHLPAPCSSAAGLHCPCSPCPAQKRQGFSTKPPPFTAPGQAQQVRYARLTRNSQSKAGQGGYTGSMANAASASSGRAKTSEPVRPPA